jgi:hypothetical protein
MYLIDIAHTLALLAISVVGSVRYSPEELLHSGYARDDRLAHD